MEALPAHWLHVNLVVDAAHKGFVGQFRGIEIGGKDHH